jgi:hypothetical protein
MAAGQVSCSMRRIGFITQRACVFRQAHWRSSPGCGRFGTQAAYTLFECISGNLCFQQLQGMNLFGGIKWNTFLNPRVNFDNFPNAMLVLMRCVKGQPSSLVCARV